MGTVGRLAKILGRQAAARGLRPTVCSVVQCKDALLSSPGKYHAIFFAISTYGGGAPPTSAESFFAELESGVLGGLFKGIPVAVFGAGNSAYQTYFCYAAVRLHRALEKVCPQLLELRKSCELAHPSGHDCCFTDWMERLWDVLQVNSVHPIARFCTCSVRAVDSAATPRRNIEPPGFYNLEVVSKELLTPVGYERQSYRIRLRVPMAQQVAMLNRPAMFADLFYVLPRNDSAEVQRVLARLNLDPAMVFNIEDVPEICEQYRFIPERTVSVAELFQNVVDLHCPLAPSLLVQLAECATSAEEQQSIRTLAVDGGMDDPYSMGDFLEAFPSVQLSLDEVISYFPFLNARAYSMSSDFEEGKTEIFEIVFTVPKKQRKNGLPHYGVATRTMSTTEPGQCIRARMESYFVKPPTYNAPLVIVAMGAGISSARAILMRRQSEKKKGRFVAAARLLYGFHHTGKDQLFFAELEAMKKEGVLSSTQYLGTRDDSQVHTTIVDIFDDSIPCFLGMIGEVVFCGPGGNLPGRVMEGLAHVGVDIMTLIRLGKYHDKYTPSDKDTEALLWARMAHHHSAIPVPDQSILY